VQKYTSEGDLRVTLKLVKEHNPRKTKHKLVHVKAITYVKLLVQNVERNIS